MTRLGDYTSALAISGATVQTKAPLGDRTWLKRVDNQTNEVVGSRDLGGVGASGPGRIAAGEGHVWVLDAGSGTEKGALTRVAP